MQGRCQFSPTEIAEIRGLLIELRAAEHDRQKAIRARLRSRFKFFITDFEESRSGFTATDLDELLSAGNITIASAQPAASSASRLRTAASPTSPRTHREYSRSTDRGHRITVSWRGEEIETLADLLRSRLRAVAVGINPTPKSVAAGHYYQGNYGQTFFRRLRKAGLLPDGDDPEDDRAFAAGIGFTDVVKRPTTDALGLRPGELEHGRLLLEKKLAKLDVPVVIFVFKSAAETLLGPLPPRFYGLVPRRRLGEARVFVMPAPTAATAIESDAIKKLKRTLRPS